jgi:hypothetical protein
MLDGSRAAKATWIAENGSPVFSNSDNLLDVRPPMVLRLDAGSDDVETLRIAAIARRRGTYTIAVRVAYSVAGGGHVLRTDTVTVYHQ